MPIVVCKECSQKLSVPEHLAGRNYTCPKCGTVQPALAAPIGAVGVPVAPAPAAQDPNAPQWHALIGDVQYGPYSTVQVCTYIGGGMIRADTLLWRDGMPYWTPAHLVTEFAEPLRAASAIETHEFVAVQSAAPAHAEGPQASQEPGAAYERIRQASKKSDATTYLVIGGVLVGVLLIVGVILLARSRQPPRETPAPPPRVITVRVTPDGGYTPAPPTKSALPRKTPDAPVPPVRRPPEPGPDEWQPGTGEKGGEKLFDDADLGQYLAGGTQAEDLPDLQVTVDGQQRALVDVWTAYQMAVDDYEGAVSEVQLCQEKMKDAGLPDADPEPTDKERAAAYAADRQEFDKLRRARMEEAIAEYDRARSAYEDASAALKKGGSKLAYTVARQRLEKATLNRRKVLLYDLKTDKKWSDLLKEIRDKHYGEGKKAVSLPEEQQKLKDELDELTARADTARKKVELYNAAFEAIQLPLMAAGILRTGASYQVDGDQPRIGGGRWVHVVPGSDEYKRLVSREARQLRNAAEELRAQKKVREAAVLEALLPKRFPGATAP